jgi:hypothetical protein
MGREEFVATLAADLRAPPVDMAQIVEANLRGVVQKPTRA